MREDPQWVKDHNIKICRKYYVDQQVRIPMQQLLKPFGGTVEDILDHTISEIDRQRLGITQLTRFATSAQGCDVMDIPMGSKRSHASETKKKKRAPTKKRKRRKKTDLPIGRSLFSFVKNNTLFYKGTKN